MEDLALLDLLFALIPIIGIYLLVDWLVRKPRVSDVKHKYVFISGCDSGFGKLAALHLDKLGCRVFAGCLTDQGLMELTNEPTDRIVPMKLDVTNVDNIRRVYNIVARLLPEDTGLWGLVNNAGISGPIAPFDWLSDKQVRNVMDINVMGAVNMVNIFMPLLKKSKGRIVNVSSILGILATPYSGPYCMAKRAIEAFSDSLRREMYQFGVGVSIVEPGGHMTPFMDNLPIGSQQAWDAITPDKQQEYGFSFMEQVIFLSTKIIPAIASSKPQAVVDAYCHALFARYPRTRYLIGRDAWILKKVQLVLPTWVLDLCFQVPFIRAVPECMMNKGTDNAGEEVEEKKDQ